MNSIPKTLTPFEETATIENPNRFDQERERMHRQMLSSVSHDLKTPLASIIGSLEVFTHMKDKLTQEKQLALIQLALQEAYRLDNFVTNILDVAKLESGKVRVKRETTEIGTILHHCLLRLNNRLKNSVVTFSDKNRPIEAITDPVLLSRAICLILDNAVKFGGVPSVIQISFGREDEYTGFIDIRDNGAGIPTEQAQTIFSKYTRLVKEDQQNAGMGLGLTIGKEITRLLGGDISVKNHQQGGAIFTLHFALQ